MEERIVNTLDQNNPKKHLSLLNIVFIIISVLLIISIIFLNLKISVLQKSQEIVNKIKSSVVLEDNTGVVIETPSPEEQEKNKQLSDFYTLTPVSQPTFKVEFSFTDNKYHIASTSGSNSNYKDDFYKWLDKQGFKDLSTDLFVFENQ